MEFVTLFLSRSGRAQEAPPKGRGKQWAKCDQKKFRSRGCGRSGKPRHGPKDPFDLYQFCFHRNSLAASFFKSQFEGGLFLVEIDDSANTLFVTLPGFNLDELKSRHTDSAAAGRRE